MAEIFVSYKSEDRAKARLVADSLAAEGLDVWWDPALQAGEDYQETIDRNLREALVVVVLWSQKSAKSRWVRSEATVGDNFGALAPVKIEPCDLPTAFLLVQTADLTQWSGDRDDPAWREFVGDVVAKRTKRLSAAGASGRASAPDAEAIEGIFWQSIKDSTDVADFRSYQRRYPHGHFAEIAANRIATLESARRSVKPAEASPRSNHSILLGLMVAVLAVGVGAAVWLHPWAPSASSQTREHSDTSDACEPARRDWEAIRDTTNSDVLNELLRETPEACAVLRAEVRARLNEVVRASPAQTQRTSTRRDTPLPAPPVPQRRTQPLVVEASGFVGLVHTALGECMNDQNALANARPCGAVPENAAEIRFSEPVGQTYRLDVRYAAEQSRPISIYVNGSLALANVLGQTTGGWEAYNQQWVTAGAITTREGANTIRLYRNDVFPHISAIRLTPLN
ncbi:MAG: TIR domain-containing protein [Hyphomonadaceae bacterium]